ncbi:hypothetical protein [Aeromicrobium duanguangcaii]|uniref:Sensor domain-containing protein n=1 Tax=Aeromicrobium duanguangcaii TaxID=2968086 RepID=A0ABY5KEX7_9ACTN|nr:hypothetical protein [Aeromicrobium duanguangcaii]MCD9154980.1 hypothetical protein [Aeromicrobium duanguangcaii]UUI67615.1 hypothetical protein NP095_10405 [Aeromicrobium duanguangcaii]
MMRRLAVTAVLAATLALAACGDETEPKDDEPAGLLQRSDLPEVEDVTVSDQPRVTATTCPAMTSEWNLAVSEEFRSAEYQLADGSLVQSSIQGPASGSDMIEPTFTRLAAMIDECAGTTLRNGTFERLDALTDGQLGFVATQENENGTQVTERAYARVDDQLAVSVTVVHTGDGEPAVSAADLLPTAVERASDA